MKFREYITEDRLEISSKQGTLETLNLKFTKKNIEKIAYNYDAEIQKIEMDIKFATLKDNLGRLIFVEIKRGRRR